MIILLFLNFNKKNSKFIINWIKKEKIISVKRKNSLLENRKSKKILQSEIDIWEVSQIEGESRRVLKKINMLFLQDHFKWKESVDALPELMSDKIVVLVIDIEYTGKILS